MHGFPFRPLLLLFGLFLNIKKIRNVVCVNNIKGFQNLIVEHERSVAFVIADIFNHINADHAATVKNGIYILTAEAAVRKSGNIILKFRLRNADKGVFKAEIPIPMNGMEAA